MVSASDADQPGGAAKKEEAIAGSASQEGEGAPASEEANATPRELELTSLLAESRKEAKREREASQQSRTEAKRERDAREQMQHKISMLEEKLALIQKPTCTDHIRPDEEFIQTAKVTVADAKQRKLSTHTTPIDRESQSAIESDTTDTDTAHGTEFTNRK
eukprot:1786166-Prymnesium_polylepis.1